MADAAREVWITGLGLVSCLGEGPDAHWQRLAAGEPGADTTSFAPWVVHPLVPLALDTQIPKKGDQRQMEPWQRTGTYAAGLALESAGVKGDKELLGRMDMIVAAGGGERDYAADGAILAGLRNAADPGAYLNERLMSDLRPTLFLAQLSNLLAGNISVVHGVTGSSRTFMGEEGAGIEAARTALSRIKAGQSDIALVGGSQNGERKDLLMLFEFGGFALKDAFEAVWNRDAAPGFALASLGAFLVLEARDHAEKRGAKPLAKLSAVVSDQVRRTAPGAIESSLGALWDRLPPVDPARAVVLSGAAGTAPATAEEKAVLAARGLPVRATGTFVGHSLEPQFVVNLALATVALGHGKLFPPCDPTGFEAPFEGALGQVVVTGVGHWRGEGLALVEAVG
ncbi:3-oxoacyl-acyl carrier protein synthase II [Rhodovulum sp. PH10]|uniref:beta-ketoacyl-ACP synthase n=1 Tax=Rhodovulum sp. PH10 TaxID=1187851 RepID=UPI00027C21BE|nr:beta-ketoacyl-ACP synthase [Rhodovulum sp. PH10]EJW12369.1 3-oxoacyl-acyl carrier protein synthase II [Rhodovulum sp. PH10]